MKAKRKAKRKPKKGKTVVATVNGIKVREVRPGCFLVRVRRAGLNHSETFASLEAARLKCQQLHAEQTQNGLSAFEISAKIRQDAKEAADLLAGRCSLVDAARLWVKHNPDGGAVTVSEVVERYITDLEGRKARPASLRDVRIRLNRFVADYGEHPATTISAENISEWLEMRVSGAVNSNTYRRRIHAAFAFAKSKKIVDANPVADVKPIKTDERDITCWQPQRVEALLRAAQAFNPKMIPLLVVSAFCGLRPEEASKLDWAQVNLKSRKIRVLAATSKTRKKRTVKICDSAAAWLVPHRQASGRVAPAPMTCRTWKRRLSAVSLLGVDKVRARIAKQDGLKGTEIKRKRLGWDAVVQDAKKKEAQLWPADILRHSFASAWLATHKNIFELAEEMGNSPTVIKAHYDGAMDEDQAARYWPIMPDKATGKVISLQHRIV
jgi:integrase/recombinase XerD